ncbi:hypothetical protein K431DRAFT_287008 [Polychaeton citri CBS 116435]|uniref:Chitin-binding type-1 domain-containing protein n=1 Tax=Polychaeton citri CBS 116435 TaxID=1314669 RepID=A0A9P4Q418_9PEZI|nr:hypothetical protein K431DRAFT_287008 [Polychaeton citri CBS 116435]
MHSLNVLVLAALAAAVPFPSNHQHAHLHHRRIHDMAKRAAIPPLARSISTDGSCGSWSGSTCAPGYCCSSLGWCGNSAEACGAGCQSGFGQCGSGNNAPESSAAASSSNAAVSPAEVAPTAYSHPAYNPPAESNTWAPVQSETERSTSAPAPATTATTSTLSTSFSTSVQPTTTDVAPTTSTYVAPTTSSYAAPSTTAAAPQPAQSYSGSDSSSSGGKGNTYNMYSGDGSVSSGWPGQGDWVDFESMWSANLEALISKSCSQFGVDENSDEENADIKSSINSVASSAGVDPRFILAIVVQESKGCVRVPTTSWSVSNPGLMQSHSGTGTCNSGSPVSPCPSSEIQQMINDGSDGTSSGDGLKQLLAQCSEQDAQKYYKAARMYNSGSVDPSGDLGAGIATHCYSSDIANRLTGWTDATSSCTLD